MARFRKRGTKWEASISWYDGNNERHWRTKGGFATKQTARKYAAEMESKLLTSGLSAQDPTFADYFDEWFDVYKKSTVTEATKLRYLNNGRILRRYFGKRRLSQVSRRQYQIFMTKYGETHAPSSVRKFNSVVRECVKAALIDKIITEDFTAGVKMGGDPERALHVEYLSIKELNQLVNAAIDGANCHYTSRYMILTAIFTGMRLGEIMALTWDDVNFNFKTISITKAWDYNRGGVFKAPKTKSSIRTIRVNDLLLQMLAQLKQNNTKMVFENQFGTIPTSNAVNKVLRSLLSDCGLSKRDFHFHSLRHSHVAFLLANGVPLYAISKRLGHSNTTITANRYAYLIEELKARSDEQIENSLNQLGANLTTKTTTKLKINNNR